MVSAKELEQLAVILSNTVASMVVFGAWFFEKLPPMAALAAILWTGWQWYYHPKTVELRNKRRAKRRSVKP